MSDSSDFFVTEAFANNDQIDLEATTSEVKAQSSSTEGASLFLEPIMPLPEASTSAGLEANLVLTDDDLRSMIIR